MHMHTYTPRPQANSRWRRIWVAVQIGRRVFALWPGDSYGYGVLIGCSDD